MDFHQLGAYQLQINRIEGLNSTWKQSNGMKKIRIIMKNLCICTLHFGQDGVMHHRATDVMHDVSHAATMGPLCTKSVGLVGLV